MSEENAQSKLKKGVIRINIADNRALYQAYMPVVDGCGIFVATSEQYQLEQEVFVFLQLPQDMGKFAVSSIDEQRRDLGWHSDIVRLSLSGNLRSAELLASDGRWVRGECHLVAQRQNTGHIHFPRQRSGANAG